MMSSLLGTGGSDQTKKIRLYRNGDDNFFGKDFVLNPRQCRNYDSFLQIVTNQLQFGQAVRSIHTPVGGTEITDIKTLMDKADYVAVGNGRFKRIPYPQLYNQHIQKLNECKKRKEKNLKPGDRDENRIYADVTRGTTNKSTPYDVVSIWVYCNGEEFEPARRVVLKPRMLQNWGLIYTEINQHINPRFGAVRCLYSLDGSMVSDVDQLRTGNFYVASSRYSGFKTVGYGARRSTFNVSTRPHHQPLRLTEEHDETVEDRPDGSSRGGGGGGGHDDFGQMEPVPPSKPRTRKKRSSDAQVIYSDGTRVFRKYKKKKKAKKTTNRQKGSEDESSKKSSSNFRAKSPYDETHGSEEIPDRFTLSELNEDQEHKTKQYNGYNRSGATQSKDAKSREMEGTSHQEGGVRVIHSREYTQDDAAVVIQTAYRKHHRLQKKRHLAATKIQATYRGYHQRKILKKESTHSTGDQDPSSVVVVETGSGGDQDAGTNTKTKPSKVESNKGKLDQPRQDPSKTGPVKQEDKIPDGSSTKGANQSAVHPPTKVEANHTPVKEPSKETTKGAKKK